MLACAPRNARLRCVPAAPPGGLRRRRGPPPAPFPSFGTGGPSWSEGTTKSSACESQITRAHHGYNQFDEHSLYFPKSFAVFRDCSCSPPLFKIWKTNRSSITRDREGKIQMPFTPLEGNVGSRRRGTAGRYSEAVGHGRIWRYRECPEARMEKTLNKPET